MTIATVTQDEVIERSKTLPGFPLVIRQILEILDDPEANTEMLAACIEHDPIVTARVLSVANIAATGSRRQTSINDIFTATSLIGLNRVREMAMLSSIGHFVGEIAPSGAAATFWQHSVAVGICSEELALHTAAPASSSAALIAGLLHDVGQLWLYRFNPDVFHEAWTQARSHGVGIEEAERDAFGVDHSLIGGWLAEHWSLPQNIAAAIRHHHAPDANVSDSLVPLVHVAEVLSNALDLTSRGENRVVNISSAACRMLGLTWDESIRPLFGRMEARSSHANAFFQPGKTQ